MVHGARFDLTFSRPPAVTASTSGGFAPTTTPVETACRGSLDLLTSREVERAAAMGTRATAAARVPLGTDVGAADTMQASADGPVVLQDELAGLWLVAAVQHTRTHLRVLLRRAA